MLDKLIFSNHVAATLDEIVAEMRPAGVFLLVDANTRAIVLPRLQAESPAAASAKVIAVKAGEINKGMEGLTAIWKQLSDGGASRHSLLVNLGGGVVTDMGAFAAATFKRGIRFINIPTTLLCTVDASVGGKTGINFNGLKNEVGAFAEAAHVIISTIFFRTLTREELLSGYAEMMKHALLTSPQMVTEIYGYDIEDYHDDTLLELVKRSVEVKRAIVEGDPREAGPRKLLNLGHTAGHAFEMLALKRLSPLPHGYAVAFGTLVAMVLSHLQLGFPSASLHRYASWVKELYGAFAISCDDYPTLLAAMHHDKKNLSPDTPINATLLKAIGQGVFDQPVADDQMTAALDIYRDLLGL